MKTKRCWPRSHASNRRRVLLQDCDRAGEATRAALYPEDRRACRGDRADPGQVPDSVWEWWVAKGLDRLKLRYHYQYAVFGGNVRGGYKIDFLVYTQPLYTMLEPMGDHWHTEQLAADDRAGRSRLRMPCRILRRSNDHPVGRRREGRGDHLPITAPGVPMKNRFLTDHETEDIIRAASKAAPRR